MNILIVDDLMTTRLFIRKLLRKLGFSNVSMAGDGEEALIEFKVKQIDLIICDWNMPNMDGMVFFKHLQKDTKLKNIPFLLMTAEKGKEKVVEAIKSGINHYIVKPVELGVLEKKLKEILEDN